MITFVCLKVGTKYSSDYVNALYSMSRKHLTVPHRFLCITDDPQGVNCETIPEDTGFPGWWGKLGFFRESPYGLTGRILFCDLDNLIVGNIDSMLDREEPLVAVEDFTHPNQFNSAFFLLEIGSNTRVWNEFNKTRIGRVYGDQDWITPRVKFARWPQSHVVSYKIESRTGPPPEARVVCFHGDPKPSVAPGWAGQTWRAAASIDDQRSRHSHGEVDSPVSHSLDVGSV